MSQIRSFSPKNEFRFACPVFGAEVKLADCLNLREEHCRGRRPPERRGCQACMQASKCPIIRLLQTVHRTGEDPGCYSAEPKVGHLPADVTGHIAPIVVSARELDLYDVPPSERELILASNEAAGNGVKKAAARKPIKLDALVVRETPESAAEPAIETDMAAAITRAAKRETEVPARSPEKAAEPRPAPKAATPTPASPKPPQRREIAKTPTPAEAVPKAPAKGISLLELARQRKAAAA